MNIDLTSQIHLAAIAMGSGLAGMLAHAIKKWIRKEAESPWGYLVRDNFRATVASLGALVAAVAGAIAGSLFVGMSLLQIVIMAFPYGYANDSLVNQGVKPGEIKPQ